MIYKIYNKHIVLRLREKLTYSKIIYCKEFKHIICYSET